MIEPTFEALLVTTISLTVLLPSSLLLTTLATITLPTITGTADPELHSTSGRVAETMTENRFLHRIGFRGLGPLDPSLCSGCRTANNKKPWLPEQQPGLIVDNNLLPLEKRLRR